MKMRAFTLAETLIVIGIIGVVAALTLPNLNHATGDKETVTRVMKAYSMLSEATDRAVAIYGPIEEWSNQAGCLLKVDGWDEDFYSGNWCYLNRISEFLKITKKCDGNWLDSEVENNDCTDMSSDGYIGLVLSDGMTVTANGFCDCETTIAQYNDICFDWITVDINGDKKGKNEFGIDRFAFMISNSVGVIPYFNYDCDGSTEEKALNCVISKNEECTDWIVNYGNLDYLKTDNEGKCNDNPSIILDGVNNTSCH